MNSTIVNTISSIKQDAQDGKLTRKGHSLTTLIHNVIREYGKYSHGTCDVHLSDLSLSDKKLLLSHVLDSEEYAWACEHPHRVEALMQEHERYISKLIYEECPEVYREDMEEMGMVSRRHADNGEQFWTRR
jgi:hypothetical protein